MGVQPVKLTIKGKCWFATMNQWRSGAVIPGHQMIRAGTEVDYVAHLPGGMVHIRCGGRDMVIHPGATEEFSTNHEHSPPGL